ncbi:hypothetical protein LCGC14_0425650 [marine sediment metagenome]|uniref:Uncharacterized protein n=1 Tax=marine sediment metagenome TaxID=412755 RepID=A0A0F9VYY8_9ZZZZ
MSEIALRTTERKLQKAKYLAWRPVGSTIVCCSDSLIRRKWLEICCDLVSPKKRDNFRNIPGWQRLCDAWTSQLREAWLGYDRPTKQYKIGRLLMDKLYPQVVWKELIEPIGVLKDLPFAPEADVRVHDTWLWSEEERKRYFIIVNEDASNDEVESWQGVEERDEDTGEVLPDLAGGEVRDSAVNFAVVWKKQVEYKTEIGLSGGTLTDIADRQKIVQPRFDKPVLQIKVARPDITMRKQWS